MNLSQKLSAVASTNSLLFGFAICLLDGIDRSLLAQFRNSGFPIPDRLYLPLVNSILYVGALVGSFLGSSITPRVGLRNTMVLTSCTFATGAVVVLAAPSLSSILVSRMVSGLAVGMTCNSVPLFIAQSSASQEKGSNGSMHQIGISIGIFLAMVQGIVNDAYFHFSWQVLTAGIPLAVSLAAIGFAIRFPSDVAWLLACDKEAAATEVAARLYGREADVRLDRFRALQKNSHVSKGFRGVLEPQYRWCVLSGAAVAIVQQVSGVNVVCSTFGGQLRELGLGSNSVALFTVLLNLSNILTTVCMAPHYNTSNISTLIRSGLLAMALCLLVPCLAHTLAESQMTSVFVASGCVLFVSVFSATLGPLTWIYLAELFPLEVRNTALSVCGALNLSASFLTVFVAGFFPVIDTLYVFGSVSLAGVVCEAPGSGTI
ncbi:MAG: hypothetical protein KVP17_004752 [Porospora cf. gigantea B]|uniref:uncharacterized protein n=1 Tax=Porospora cf. gigantea B TaxID=2853592 RepID=UPI003571F8DB|nr:MAG: hypothetical protein KVP17_004752 [Porospora cf. gigantea B]